MRPRHIHLPLLLLSVVPLWSCTHASAKTAKLPPPMEVPAPPPRVIETVEVPQPPPVGLVEEPARQPIRPPAGQAPRTEAARPRGLEGQKSDTAEVPRAEEPSRPATTLQTTPTEAEAEVERAIRAVMGRASADLARVNYQALNADARNQYDTAKRFVQQADAELRTTRNLVFARNLADKAAALAAQLAGR